MFKPIFISSLILLVFTAQQILTQEGEEEEECPVVHCPDYDVRKYIYQEWKTTSNLTPLLKLYRDAILLETPNATGRDLTNLLAQTAWVTVQLVNLKATLGANCVFKKVIKQILHPDEDRHDIFKTYVDLTEKAINATRDVTMVLTGCIEKHHLSSNITDFQNDCKTDDLVEEMLASNKTEMHDILKPIVAKMIKSDLPEESISGTSALMATTTVVINFFHRVVDLESFVQFIKFHNCPVKIPPQCCTIKRNYVDNITDALQIVSLASAREVVNEIVTLN